MKLYQWRRALRGTAALQSQGLGHFPLAVVLSGAGGSRPVLFGSTGGKGLSSYPRLNGIFLTFFIFTLNNSNVSVKLLYSVTKTVCSLVEFCTWKTLY